MRNAEGATAPETLRQKDRFFFQTLKSCWIRHSTHRRSKLGFGYLNESLRFQTEGAHTVHGAGCALTL